LASSLLFASGAAQSQLKPAPGSSDRAGASTGGRDAFIAPVVDIRIQDQGLALPRGLEEAPITPPAPTPVATPPDAKSEPAKNEPPATGK
jgi:hypothetical protein